jgi:hypothetical protein
MARLLLDKFTHPGNFAHWALTYLARSNSMATATYMSVTGEKQGLITTSQQ